MVIQWVITKCLFSELYGVHIIDSRQIGVFQDRDGLCLFLTSWMAVSDSFFFFSWSLHVGNWRMGEVWTVSQDNRTLLKADIVLLNVSFWMKSWIVSCLWGWWLGFCFYFQLTLKGENSRRWSKGEIHFQGFETRQKIGRGTVLLNRIPSLDPNVQTIR